MRKTWQLIRQALDLKPKKDGLETTSLKINNLILNDPKQIAQAFNDFFVNIPHTIINEINKSDHSLIDDPQTVPSHSFDLINQPISHDEIFQAVKALQSKQSTDLNNISMSFIKKCIYVLYIPLTHIFNLSFESGTVPDKMKIAKIVPVFKNGSADSPDNYRPISLLCNFAKIPKKLWPID